MSKKFHKETLEKIGFTFKEINGVKLYLKAEHKKLYIFKENTDGTYSIFRKIIIPKSKTVVL